MILSRCPFARLVVSLDETSFAGQLKRNTMAKVFITRRIPEEAIELLKNAPEVAEVKVNPDNRVLSRQGTLSSILRKKIL